MGLMKTLEIIKLGANAKGLELIGDRLIGFKFVGGEKEDREAANSLLNVEFDNTPDHADFDVWCSENRDGDFDAEKWKQ